MKTLLIKPYFAKRCTSIDPVCYESLKEAIQFVSHNLYKKHGIIIDCECFESTFFIYLGIPDELYDVHFNVGRHLKGISHYCLSHYPNLYEDFKRGKRLFYYIEQPTKEG